MKTLLSFLGFACLVGSTVAILAGQTTEPVEDCASYGASDLRLTDIGDRGWRLSRTDGAIFMILDTKQDADIMLAVFKAHSAFCYVGRNNRRENRDVYVHHYWRR